MCPKDNKQQTTRSDLVFYIKVQFRCNSSMQGTIHWMDGRKSSVFRSALELGNLINDARLKALGEEEKVHGFMKWKDKEGVS